MSVPIRSRTEGPPDLPLWRLLTPGVGFGVQDGPAPVTCALPDRGRGWRQALAAATEGVPSEGFLLVAAERSVPRAILDVLVHGRWRRQKTIGTRRLVHALGEAGFEVLATYRTWPSAREPRVTFASSGLRVVRWAQRSGVLGGGGHRLVARGLARSILFTPLAWLLAPGILVVARRTASGSR